MDLTPWIHAAIAVTVQALVGLLLGNWWLGATLACCWWIAREHTQAEYRWIEKFGGGKRSNMPEWGGFDPRVWNLGSMLDWMAPVIVCTGIYFFVTHISGTFVLG